MYLFAITSAGAVSESPALLRADDLSGAVTGGRTAARREVVIIVPGEHNDTDVARRAYAVSRVPGGVRKQGRSWQSRRAPAKSADDHFVEGMSHRKSLEVVSWQ